MPVLVILLGAFLALNIGASGAGCALAPVCGSGLLHRRAALVLFAACVVVGALVGGRAVTATLSRELVTPSAFSESAVLAVTGAAALALLLANTLRVPQSTTQVTVAAIAGAGLAGGGLDPTVLLRIVLTWAICPLLALILAYAGGRWLESRLAAWLDGGGRHRHMAQVSLVIAVSLYMALGADLPK